MFKWIYFLVIGEMLINIKMKYSFIFIKKVKIEKFDDI